MTTTDITVLLQRWSAGDKESLSRLAPLLYDELHSLARRCLSSQPRGRTLRATALLNELYLKLASAQNPPTWQSRTHFLAAAAKGMRRLIIDHSRTRLAAKRGGGVADIVLENHELPYARRDEDLIALDEALERLAEVDALKSQIVELRFFCSMTIEETAEAVGVAPATVKRHWTLARAWLAREMQPL